jgi:hypothetical protein
LTTYLDSSVLVSMFSIDANSPRAQALLASIDSDLSCSDWCLAEFTSALAIGMRVGRLTTADRDAAEASLGTWLAVNGRAEPVQPDDIRVGRSLIRATRLPLRASDALHLAIAQRLGDAVATFDIEMARAAIDLGMPTVDLSPHP